MDPEAALQQVISDLNDSQGSDALTGLNGYAQWVSHGGFPADNDTLDALDTAVQSWADRWDV